MRRSTTAVVLGWGAVLLLFCGLVSGWAAEPPGAKSISRSELEAGILSDLARGRSVTERLEEYSETVSGLPRPPRRPRSRAASELGHALGGFHRQASAWSLRRDPGDLERLLAAYDTLRAADLLYRERFQTVRTRLQQAEVGSEILERLEAAEAAYLESQAETLANLEEPLAELRAALRDKRQPEAALLGRVAEAVRAASESLDKQLEPRQVPILRAQLLPYDRPALTQQTPITEPAIQPSYLDPADPTPSAADYAATPEAPLAEEILLQAEALGYDYVRIWEFVRNRIDTEWYAGSMKGALGTLRQGAGNEVDQASLLIALFRASQAPARYVHGVVERSVEELAAELGLETADQVLTVLAAAGIAHRPLIRGGGVAAVELEHTWVTAYLPYTNYRGAVVDFSGETWVPLAPAIKSYDYNAATRVLEGMGLSSEETVTEYLAAPQPEDLLSVVRGEVTYYLEQNAPGESYDDQLGFRSLVPSEIGLVPSTLPVQAVAVTGEEPALSPRHKHSVRLLLRQGPGESDPVVLDTTLPLAELAGQRVTLSYQPATVDDHTTVNLFGGLDATPLYLIRLRPQIKVAGRQRVVGEVPLEAGIQHRFELELTGPAGTERVGQTVITGGYYAMALTTQQDDRVITPTDDPADTEYDAARILSSLALGYSEQWGSAERELAGLLDVALVRPLPALAMTGLAVTVGEVLGLPVNLVLEGVTLDAALRAAEPIARGVGEEAVDWMRLSALQGSALEHFLFEEQLLVESISADKGLGLARLVGTQVYFLDPSNIDSILPGLDHPVHVKAEIDNWVRLGMVVEVPAGPVTFESWQGSVWRVEDPATGAAGYFIAGALAGGATAEPPDSWVLDFLADALEAPYSGEPNTDPLAGVEIVKLAETDNQTGEVGELFAKELGVLVRDAEGRPVEGAVVEFSVVAGGGSLIEPSGAEAEVVIVATDQLGIASVALLSGRQTDANPLYTRLDASDQHTTRVLVNEVDVIAQSAGGALLPDTEFTAIAQPGPPAQLQGAWFGGGPFSSPGFFLGTIEAQVLDRFTNPISNVPVIFSVLPPETTCDPPPPSLENAAVFADCPTAYPLLGECGGPSVAVVSSQDGARAGVIAGNSFGTTYTVAVDAAGLEPLSFSFFTPGLTEPCESWVAHRIYPEHRGGSTFAALAGQEVAGTLEVTLFYSAPDYVVESQPGGTYVLRYLSTQTWHRTTAADVTFSVDNGGQASPTVDLGDGTYQSRITTGPTPGVNNVYVDITAMEIPRVQVDRETGGVSIVIDRRDFSERIAGYHGLAIRVVGVDPTPMLLTEEGRTAEAATVVYEIVPGEYEPREQEIEINADGEPIGFGIGSSEAGLGGAVIQRGFAFDIDQQNEVELVLNRGSVDEMRSAPFELPLEQTIFTDVTPQIYISQEVDLLNDRACEVTGVFDFGLTQDATVTFNLRKIEGIEPDGSFVLGDTTTLIDGVELSEGPQSLDLQTEAVAVGDYEFELLGVAATDGHLETRTGLLLWEYKTRDSLPVGHVIIKGVDLWDGHLVVSREDFQVPGRGVPLDFRRTYSSNAGGQGGLLGAGWSHNWDSKIVVTPCGEVIVIGGEGSGMRFVDDGEEGLRPLKGYHGSLLANPEDSSFDFYSKNGTRYHYVHSTASEWRLDFITDTNGNTTRLYYDTNTLPPRLETVIDSSGRTLDFDYETRVFTFWGGEVITSITGPDGIRVDFEYDDFGNLTRAAREPHPDTTTSRAETYAYALPPAHAVEDRHRLLSVTNDLSGAVTSYEYDRAPIGIQGDIQVPSDYVKRLIEPEGGETLFSFDLTGLGSRDPPELTTLVTDPRAKVTTYTLDQYGSPLEILDPEGNLTTMTWDPDDVVMRSRTDANGAYTEFTYDEHANLVTETITVTDFDGTVHTYVLENTYWPAESFEPPGIKNRLATRTDRNGAVTSFTYDSKGNLEGQSITVTDVDGFDTTLTTTHTYDDFGDRWTTTDPRENTTLFTYDTRGNLETVTDERGLVSTTDWNERSLPIARTDARGYVTSFEYDTLGRLVKTVHPLVTGDSEPAEELTIYDDVNNRLTQIDAEERPTVTTYDLEGRVIQVDNAEGGTKVFGYDPAGNKELESTWFDTTPERFDVLFEYDDAGRLAKRTEPLDRVTEYGYDGVGNVTSETLTDATDTGFAPRVTLSDYDALNRRIEVTREHESGSVSTFFKFDGEGNKVYEQDPLGRVMTQRYDGLNRLIETIEPAWRDPQGDETDAPPKVTRFLYDPNGNLAEERRLNEPKDQSRTFEYDLRNQLEIRRDAFEEPTVFDYDDAGNLEREIDPRLNVTEHTYDERNRRKTTEIHLTQVSDPIRTVITEFNYDRVGNLIEERHPNGNVVVHTYDDLNRLKTSSDTIGPLVAYDYDARGNRIAEADANGNTTENDYDALDRLVEQRLPEERVLKFGHDVAGNRISEIDALENTTNFAYDQLNRLVQATDPEPFNYTQSFTYDDVGNKLTETDRRAHTTTFDYDSLDRLVRINDPEPLAYVQTFTYDAVGNRLTETDRRGIETEFTYDKENRLTKVKRAGLSIRQIEYDQNGNRRFETDANGIVDGYTTTGFEYDERNLLIKENRAETAITHYTLDDMGDRVEELDPEKRLTIREYDERRRLIAETNGAGERTEFSYDFNGNRTGTKRPEENEWTYVYDDADRLSEVIDPLTFSTEYGYDKNDNRTSQIDANSHTTTLEYDELDRLTAWEYHSLERETSTYDENGNLATMTDPLGQITTFVYDVLNREISRSYSSHAISTGDDLLSITTDYDPNGNPLEITETYNGSTGTRFTTQTWDDFDRLTTVTDPEAKTLTYGYDANGNRTQLRDPDNRVTIYNYDKLNRAESVTVTAVGVTNYEYFKNSLLKSVTYPNGSEAVYDYDLANRVTSIENLQHGAPVSTYAYTYDKNGNRIEQLETNGGPAETTTYVYDDVDRLEEVTYPDKTTTYTYDAVGNRATEREVAPDSTLLTNKSFAYDDRDRLTAITDHLDASQSVTYGYDANGNQTSKTQDGVITDFLYDVRDQLVEVQRDLVLLGRYAYDYQGLRIRKSGSGEILRYVYDDQSVLLQTDDAGNTLAKYDYGPDRLLSLNHTTEGRQFYLFDALGSVVDLTKPDGTIQARYQWDAWGNLRASTGASANPFGFTGHEHDEATGLIYAKARFYDPEVGRFLTEDPVFGDHFNPPSLHKYLYAFGNPTVYFDPTGEIALLTKLRDKVRAGKERLIEEAGILGRSEDSGVGAIAGAVVLGVFAGAAEIGAQAVGAVNLVANLAVQGAGTNSGLANDARLELEQTWEQTKNGVLFVIEHRYEVGAELILAAEDTVRAAAAGDTQAIAQVTATAFEFAIGAKGGGAAAKAGASATRAGALARIGRRVAGSTGDAVDTASDAVQVVNRANRAQRGLQSARTAARAKTPAAGVPAGKRAPASMCFVAGTPVLTEHGLKAIEEIENGVRVWSRDEETGELALREVVELFVTTDQEVIEVEVETSNGTVEALGVTVEHPFWVEGRGWVEAGKLEVDDELHTEKDGWLRVRQVRGPPDGRQTVYNFEVADFHTYFVGQTQAWVHNACKAESAALAGSQPPRLGFLPERGTIAAARTKGNIGESLTVAARRLRGESVVGRQITFVAGGGKARFDFVTKNVFTGKLRVVEAKFGRTARLARNQPTVAREIQRTGGSLVRGRKSVQTFRDLGFEGGSFRRGLNIEGLEFVEQTFPRLERVFEKLFF